VSCRVKRANSKGELVNRFLSLAARLVFGRLLPSWAYPVLRGPLRGARFVLGAFAGECGGASVYFNRIEQEQTELMVRSLQQGQTFFDIGANAGYYTILGSRLVGVSGRVVAFEPSIRNLHYLYRHVEVNRTGNVDVFSGGCAEKMSLELFSQGDNCATGRLRKDDDENAGAPVPVISIDLFVQRTGIVPDVIKIDVEGAELSVLKGAQAVLRSSKPLVFLSIHSDKLREECLELLSGLGYRHDLSPDNVSKTSEFLLRV
jgi:FkbM family methyltransferase